MAHPARVGGVRNESVASLHRAAGRDRAADGRDRSLDRMVRADLDRCGTSDSGARIGSHRRRTAATRSVPVDGRDTGRRSRIRQFGDAARSPLRIPGRRTSSDDGGWVDATPGGRRSRRSRVVRDDDARHRACAICPQHRPALGRRQCQRWTGTGSSRRLRTPVLRLRRTLRGQSLPTARLCTSPSVRAGQGTASERRRTPQFDADFLIVRRCSNPASGASVSTFRPDSKARPLERSYLS